MIEKGGWVYIITNKNNTTLYTGVTSDLVFRIIEHKKKIYPKSFSARYQLNKLIWYEGFDFIEEAIIREKQIKGWKRYRKVELIESVNPQWKDLFENLENL